MMIPDTFASWSLEHFSRSSNLSRVVWRCHPYLCIMMQQLCNTSIIIIVSGQQFKHTVLSDRFHTTYHNLWSRVLLGCEGYQQSKKECLLVINCIGISCDACWVCTQGLNIKVLAEVGCYPMVVRDSSQAFVQYLELIGGDAGYKIELLHNLAEASFGLYRYPKNGRRT